MRADILMLLWLLAAFVPAAASAEECQCACPCEEKVSSAAPTPAPVPPPKPSGNRVASFPIAGGKTSTDALPIDYERIYKINHPLKKGQRDYFSLPLEPGTELTLAMKSLKKSEAGLQIVDLQGQTAATLVLNGAANEVQRLFWKPLKTGRHTIAIGSDTADLEANQVIFVALVRAASLECADDDPLALTFGAPHEDCFWETNVSDSFRFEGEKDDVYRIEATTAAGSPDLQVKMSLEHRGKEGEVIAGVSGAGRVTIESLALPEDGTYLLEVAIPQPSIDVLPYTLTATRIFGEK